MGHEIISIKRLAYDPEQRVVNAELTGEVGGRNVDVQLQFPFRAHGDRSEVDLRNIALLEIQQILRSASNITLPDTSDRNAVAATRSHGQNGIASWENEGGARSDQPAEIVWFGI
jgi:phage tail protein X